MAQKLRTDKIGALSHSGGNITMAASSSNPAYLTIGGQQYRISSSLAVAVGTATANTRYQIYATVSGGTVSLQKSTSENSVGPGTSSWKLIGSFQTAAANTWGAFINIENTPHFESIQYTPTVSNLGAGATSLNTARYSREGGFLYVNGTFVKDGTPGSGTGDVTTSLPTNILINSSLLPDAPTIDFRNKVGTGLQTVTTFNEATAIYSTTSSVAYTRDANANRFRGQDFTAGSVFAYEYKAPITGWSDIPIKDL